MLSPQGCIPIILLGGALLWAVQLAYGARGASASDGLKFCLQRAGWMMILLGFGIGLVILAPYAFFITIPIFLVMVLSILHRYREGEREALLWTLAHAAQRELPLSQAARAFAHERTDELGYRSWQLADALDAGYPLDVALEKSRNPVPYHVLVAIRAGQECDSLPDALRTSVAERREIDGAVQTATERLIFITFASQACLSIVTFLCIKIIPTYEFMFKEYGVGHPAIPSFTLAILRHALNFWPFYSILYALALLTMFIGLLHYVGWLPWNFPGSTFLRWSHDRAVVLRNLALFLRQQQTLPRALASLEVSVPTYGMRTRLRNARMAAEAGADPLQALRQQRIINAYELAVLDAAQRAGNLAWALETMADSALRRLMRRLRAATNVVWSVFFVLASLGVLFIGVTMIRPLRDLILETAQW